MKFLKYIYIKQFPVTDQSIRYGKSLFRRRFLQMCTIYFTWSVIKKKNNLVRASPMRRNCWDIGKVETNRRLRLKSKTFGMILRFDKFAI